MTNPAIGRAAILSVEETVAQTSFFSNLGSKELGEISGLCQPRVFQKDSAIYELGDPAEEFYILAEGMVRFSLGFGPMQTSAGEIIRRGDVFGWAALVEGRRTRLATAYCMSSSSVLAMSAQDLLGVMDRNHTVGYLLMKRLNALITGNLIHFAAG